MKYLGCIVLSYEEAGDLSGIIPWKVDNPAQLFAHIKERHVSISGLIFLSTCNRVEMIYSLDDSEHHEQLLQTILEIMPDLPNEIQPSIYKGRKALRHLIRLAAGLESMVLGETEIRAQIKDAFEDSRLSNLLDKRLRILVQDVFQESRFVRNNIPMVNLPISVASLASKKVMGLPGFLHKRDALKEKDDRAIVIIGSGPMSRQAAESLAKLNNRMVLVNRSLAKIEKLAGALDTEMATFDRFMHEPESLGQIAVIVTATSREDAFITKDFIHKLKENNQVDSARGLTLVDMALPPDVDPACDMDEGVNLISMESLREELEENKQKRVEAAEMAEDFVEDAGFRIEANLVAGLSGHIMKDIQKDVRDRSREKLELLLEGRLSHLSKKDKNLIYTWAIQAHRDLNRIHRRGLESVIRNYCLVHKQEHTL